MNTDTIDTGHRTGCAFGRTARCTCMYLMQWDKHPEYTAPTMRKDPGAPFPLEEKDYYPVVEEPVKALVVNDEIWEPRRLRLDEVLKTRYWHQEYQHLSRRYWALLACTTVIGATMFIALWKLVNP